MTIKSSLAAIIAVFSVVVLYAPTTHAEQKQTSTHPAPAPVIVTVNEGDTLTSIADAHATTYVQLFNANDTIANPDVLNAGDKVRIPTADEQLPDRYSAFAAQQAASAAVAATTQAPAAYPVYSQTYTPGAQPVYATNSAGNTYFKGYCTWYAKSRRPDLPNNLGNGGQWVANAAARGYATGTTPRVGAIAEIPGHVMYVEAVNGNSVTISEMNGPAGFGVTGTRTIDAGSARYIY